MTDCPACNPTKSELDAITGAVFPVIYDQAYDTAVQLYGEKHPGFNPEDGDKEFVLLTKQLLDQLLPQAIHSRLHCTGPVAGHKMVLS